MFFTIKPFGVRESGAQTELSSCEYTHHVVYHHCVRTHIMAAYLHTQKKVKIRPLVRSCHACATSHVGEAECHFNFRGSFFIPWLPLCPLAMPQHMSLPGVRLCRLRSVSYIMFAAIPPQCLTVPYESRLFVEHNKHTQHSHDSTVTIKKIFSLHRLRLRLQGKQTLLQQQGVHATRTAQGDRKRGITTSCDCRSIARQRTAHRSPDQKHLLQGKSWA